MSQETRIHMIGNALWTRYGYGSGGRICGKSALERMKEFTQESKHILVI
jgi:hypothetical protein